MYWTLLLGLTLYHKGPKIGLRWSCGRGTCGLLWSPLATYSAVSWGMWQYCTVVCDDVLHCIWLIIQSNFLMWWRPFSINILRVIHWTIKSHNFYLATVGGRTCPSGARRPSFADAYHWHSGILWQLVTDPKLLILGEAKSFLLPLASCHRGLFV